jgi:hypothetical protein
MLSLKVDSLQYEYEYSSAVLYSCTAVQLYSGSTAQLYESCSTAVLVLVLGILTAAGELTY